MFYLTTHSTHFIYGCLASDIWLRAILIVREETRCRHIGYSFRLAARVLLYASSHIQDSTYHSLCYTSRGALAGTRNSSIGPPYEGSIRRPIAPWANALTTELHLAPDQRTKDVTKRVLDDRTGQHRVLANVLAKSQRFKYRKYLCNHSNYTSKFTTSIFKTCSTMNTNSSRVPSYSFLFSIIEGSV